MNSWIVCENLSQTSGSKKKKNHFLCLIQDFKPSVSEKNSFMHLWFHPGLLSSVQFSCSVMSNSLRPLGLQHTRLPCASPSPGVYSNSCPSSPWCHPIISSSAVPFSSRLQYFPASGSFQMSQHFTSGGQMLKFQLQHQFFQCLFTTDFFRTD